MIIIISYIIIIGVLKVMFNFKNNYYLTFIAGFLLFLISAFRSISFGPDVIGYVNRFNQLDQNVMDYLKNFIYGVGKDPFFYLFSKIIKILGFDSQAWLAIISLFFCLSITILINRNSPDSFLSFLILISLGYFYFSLTGLRQAIALSIIIWSYKYLKEKNIIKFIIIVLFGSLFHFSAIIFLIAYPIKNIKIDYKQFIIIFLSVIFAYFFNGYIFKIIEYLDIFNNYKGYIDSQTALNMSGFIIQFIIFLFCFIYKENVLSKDKQNNILYNLLFIGIVFQSFSIVVAEFFRVSMYFSIFSIILIPKVIFAENNIKTKTLLYLTVMCVLILYIFWTSSFINFRFTWN